MKSAAKPTRPGPATRKKRSELLTIRLNEDTAQALAAAAQQRQSTLSREAADRLMRSLETAEGLKPDFDEAEDRALANLLVMLHRRLRQYTAKSWANDAYTFREFAEGVALLIRALPRLLGFAGNEPQLPERLVTIYQASPRAVADEKPTIPGPGELGRGFMTALLDVLPLYERAGGFHKTGYVREHWELPQIFHDLGLDRRPTDPA